MTTPRARARRQTLDDITRIGREHLAQYGAAGLSLRAVARDLGVVSSAVYRYVPSRDDLLTLLVVDAYGELGDAVDVAEGAVDQADLFGRFAALAGAVRTWALAHPARYGLLFGTPVPGYAAPEQTLAPGTRVIGRLLRLTAEAEAAGLRPRAPSDGVPEQVRTDAEQVRGQFGVVASDEALLAAVLVWTGLFGAISFEVFGQFGNDTFRAPDQLFLALVDLLAAALGLQPPR